MKKDLGKLYREHLQNYTPSPPTTTWGILEQRMRKRKQRRQISYAAIGIAAIAGIAIIAAFIYEQWSFSAVSHGEQQQAVSTTPHTPPTSPAATTAKTVSVSQPTPPPTPANILPETHQTTIISPSILSYTPTSLPPATIEPSYTLEIPTADIPPFNIASDPMPMETGNSETTEKTSPADDTISAQPLWTERQKLKIPNAFTPNDVINNIFKPSPCEVSNYEMYVYNRFGEKVFHSKHIEHGWDGSYKGSAAPNGTYVYIIMYTDGEGTHHEQKGQVHLLR